MLNQGVLLSRPHLPGASADVAGFQGPRSSRTIRAQENQLLTAVLGLFLSNYWALLAPKSPPSISKPVAPGKVPQWLVSV